MRLVRREIKRLLEKIQKISVFKCFHPKSCPSVNNCQQLFENSVLIDLDVNDVGVLPNNDLHHWNLNSHCATHTPSVIDSINSFDKIDIQEDLNNLIESKILNDKEEQRRFVYYSQKTLSDCSVNSTKLLS